MLDKKTILLFAGSYLLLLFIALTVQDISSNSKKSNEPLMPLEKTDSWVFANQLESKEMLIKAKSLFAMYFDEDVIIKSYEQGPSGSLIIVADIENELREFIMLPDKNHLIEGVMYSPHLTAKNVTTKHSNKAQEISSKNQKDILISKELKEQFKGQISKDVNKNALFAEKNTVEISEKPESTFKLPEINSVISSNDRESLYSQTESLQYVEFGAKTAPLVYVYFDFDCSGCRQAKKVLQRFTKSGELRVRYIPVGLISKDSPIKAAYSLIPKANQDRQLLFNYFNTADTAENLIKKKAPKAEVVTGLTYVRDANTTFMMTPKKLTPAFVFKKDSEVIIANLTSSRSIESLVLSLNK